ncbi:MAG: hypothetical protein ABEI57_00840 [Halapricum sp.]
MTATGWTLLRAMFEEEWRLHADLFGGRRFLAFPLVVLLVSGGGFVLLAETGTDQGAIAAGLHALVAFFGLQVGTIGLVGRDALRDVLGDVTLLVFSSRTLPVTWRRLLATFVLKDLLYYSLLFLAPIALAYTPLALSAGQPPLQIGLLWVTLSGSFALGVGLSLTLVGLASYHRLVGLGAIAAVTVAVVATGVDPVAATPYGTYSDPTLLGAIAGFVPLSSSVWPGSPCSSRSSGRRVESVRSESTGWRARSPTNGGSRRRRCCRSSGRAGRSGKSCSRWVCCSGSQRCCWPSFPRRLHSTRSRASRSGRCWVSAGSLPTRGSHRPRTHERCCATPSPRPRSSRGFAGRTSRW